MKVLWILSESHNQALTWAANPILSRAIYIFGDLRFFPVNTWISHSTLKLAMTSLNLSSNSCEVVLTSLLIWEGFLAVKQFHLVCFPYCRAVSGGVCCYSQCITPDEFQLQTDTPTLVWVSPWVTIYHYWGLIIAIRWTVFVNALQTKLKHIFSAMFNMPPCSQIYSPIYQVTLRVRFVRLCDGWMPTLCFVLIILYALYLVDGRAHFLSPPDDRIGGGDLLPLTFFPIDTYVKFKLIEI
jgi:hypothetical protein